MGNTWRGVVVGMVVATLFAVSGCGESKRSVIGRYQPACAQMRTRLKTIADRLPPIGSVQEMRVAKELSPPVVYHAPESRGNLEVVMEVQLIDPEVTPEFDLNLARDLIRCLAWAGPRSPMAESALDSAAGSIEHDFERALSWDYLGVVRVVKYVKPEVVSDKEFRGGELKLEVFVVRASDLEVVAAFPVAARAADRVEFTYRAAESAADRGRAFARSSVWEDARAKVADGMRQVTGGEFQPD